MAIYHLSVKYISRGQGRSAVGAAAYRAGEKLHNEYDGLTHDYSHKRGIAHREIILSPNAPGEFADRQKLWNAVEMAEKRKDARTAREIEIALPRELSPDEQIQLVRAYVGDNLTSRGICADVAIHSGHRHQKDKENIEAQNDKNINSTNPHAHILFTTRQVSPQGFGAKDRTLESRQNVRHWREAWANAQNRRLQQKGLEIKLSHESYKNQGIDKEPTKHLGHNAAALERRGIRTDRGDENRAIVKRNRQREERQKQRQQKREQNRECERKRIRDLSR